MKEIYNKEICEQYAKQCKTRKEFRELFGGSVVGATYRHAKLDPEWRERITEHFISYGNLFNRLVYVAKFDDNSIYVGLTYNIQRRIKDHYRKGSVYNHLKTNNNILPEWEILTDFVDVKEAQQLERYYVNFFRENGYKLFKRKCDFSKQYKRAYENARICGYLDEICSHMNKLERPKYYWNYETCKTEASKYTSRWDFGKNSKRSYYHSLKIPIVMV